MSRGTGHNVGQRNAARLIRLVLHSTIKHPLISISLWKSTETHILSCKSLTHTVYLSFGRLLFFSKIILSLLLEQDTTGNCVNEDVDS